MRPCTTCHGSCTTECSRCKWAVCSRCHQAHQAVCPVRNGSVQVPARSAPPQPPQPPPAGNRPCTGCHVVCATECSRCKAAVCARCHQSHQPQCRPAGAAPAAAPAAGMIPPSQRPPPPAAGPSPPGHRPPPPPAAAPVPGSPVPQHVPPPSMVAMPQRARDALARLRCALGDRGEVVARLGNRKGTIVGATEEALMLDLGGNRVTAIPFVDITVFTREGGQPQQGPARQSPLKRSGALQRLELLGQGAQGQVWKARYADAPPAEFVVVKDMMFPAQQQQAHQKAGAQARHIMNLHNEHLIEYIDIIMEYTPALKVCVVMPFYNEKDMLNFVTNLPEPLSEYRLCSLVLQITDALNYLHTLSPPMVHRDVKLENILMFNNFSRTMLMDLDMVRELDSTARLPGGGKPGIGAGNVTVCGTFEYMAPEVQAGRDISPKSDVWSLGALAFILVTLPQQLTVLHPKQKTYMPLNSPHWTDPKDLDATVASYAEDLGRRYRRKPYSPRLVNLVCRMLRHETQGRPSAAEVGAELQEIMLGCITSPDNLPRDVV